MKHCPDCKQDKDEIEFYSNRCQKDGLDNLCKACRTIRTNNRHARFRKINARRGPVMEGEKICRHCLFLLPITKFGVDTCATDGRNSWCLACRRAYKQMRRASKGG
jgi:hypothetical protein